MLQVSTIYRIQTAVCPHQLHRTLSVDVGDHATLFILQEPKNTVVLTPHHTSASTHLNLKSLAAN